MRIIGITDGHNASVAYLENGHLQGALQEERLSRVKNHEGFPALALDYMLRSNNLEVTDIDYLLIVSNYLPRTAHYSREKRMYAYKKKENSIQILKNFAKRIDGKKVISYMSNQYRRNNLISQGVQDKRISFVDHHSSHAASAYYGWGRFDEPILVMTNDGAGDDLCATISIANNGEIERISQVHMDHSVGELWAVITAMMGMVPLEHEHKLMGLAPYAPESGALKVKKVFEDSFEFLGNGLEWRVRKGIPSIPMSYNYFRNKMEFMRFDWIGAGLQLFTEDFLTQWVNNAIRKTGIKKIALSGGIFMNVKSNKRIAELPDVDELFIFPSCGDETNAIGAVYAKYYEITHDYNESLQGLYLGTYYTSDDVRTAYDSYPFKHRYRIWKSNDIPLDCAKLISSGHIVAWFQGREEFGARALGARSIIADPTKKNVISIINNMIKSRDFWMPFASSMLQEGAKKYLVNPKEIASPYMATTFDTTDAAEDIEGGRHPFDKTCRPQIVVREWNPIFHNLLTCFMGITGRQGILNTSFNLHGLPIASSPQDAFLVLDESGLPYLAIEEWIIQKTD